MIAAEILKQEKLEKEKKEQDIAIFKVSKNSILDEIQNALEQNNFNEALSKSEEYLFTLDPDIILLHAKAKDELVKIEVERKARVELQKIEAAKVKALEEVDSILRDLKTIPEKEYAKNASLYERLVVLVPESAEYKGKLEFYNSKIELEKQNKIDEEKREERIELQFSSWDGSHRNLTKIIKIAMNDPDSYKHDKTVYWDQGDHLVVLTNYRGRNGFGGMVRGYVKAKVDMDGNVLEILEEG